MKKISKRKVLTGILCLALAFETYWLSNELFKSRKEQFLISEEISDKNKEIVKKDKEIVKKDKAIIERDEEIASKDEKITSLESELHKYKNSFLEFDIEQKFKIAAEIYQIDFDILYAISRLETGNFTSELFMTKNNPGGIKTLDGTDYQSFDSDFEGIVEMARLLKRYYFDEGLTTIEAIGAKYCPNPEEKWAEKVKELID